MDRAVGISCREERTGCRDPSPRNGAWDKGWASSRHGDRDGRARGGWCRRARKNL